MNDQPATPGNDSDRWPLSEPFPAIHLRIVHLKFGPVVASDNAVQWPRQLTARALSETRAGVLRAGVL
jgi:hypothetical protein